MKLPGARVKVRHFLRALDFLSVFLWSLEWWARWWVCWSICVFMWKLNLQATHQYTRFVLFLFFFPFLCSRHSIAKLGNEKEESWSRIQICRWCARERPFLLHIVRQRWQLSPLIHPRQENQKKMSVFGTNRKCNKFATLQYKQCCRYSWLLSGQIVLLKSFGPLQPAVTSYWISTIVFRRRRCRFFSAFRSRSIFRSFVHPSNEKERTKNNNNLTKHML